MIVEYIRYELPSWAVETFVQAYERAAVHLVASPHCLSYELSRGVEEPERCIVRIEWDSIAGHETHFTSSSLFPPFIEEIRSWLGYIVEMNHYSPRHAASGFRTRGDPMAHVRQIFLGALARVRPVLAASSTSASWGRPSQLREMTVGSLAAHLLRAVTTVATYLEAPPPEGAPIEPAAYYTRVLPNSDLHDPVHVGIRERAQRGSEQGHAGVVSSWDGTVADLSSRLTKEPEDRTLRAAGDLVMRLDDYLVTRLVEVVVHVDDLAVSVGVDTPDFDPAAVSLVFDHLIEIARLRHGDLAVLRAFTRRERDAVQALRVF